MSHLPHQPAALPLAAETDSGEVPPWQCEIARRMRHHLLLKTAGICLFMAAFFSAYFHVLRHPVWPVTVMPLTPLDLAIPFTPSALAVYGSLWLYVGIAPGLMPTLRAAAIHGLWAAALCGSGLAIFYFFPTAVPPPVPAIDTARHAGFALLQGVDASGNACPSLHVASAVFSAFWIDRVLKDTRAPVALQVLNGVWMLAIAWSTLATRQHVVIDVAAGALLGAAFAWASLRRR